MEKSDIKVKNSSSKVSLNLTWGKNQNTSIYSLKIYLTFKQ